MFSQLLYKYVFVCMYRVSTIVHLCTCPHGVKAVTSEVLHIWPSVKLQVTAQPRNISRGVKAEVAAGHAAVAAVGSCLRS